MDPIDQFLESMLTLERWPFWSAVLIFTVIGQFTTLNLFTRERAYATWEKTWQVWFWWWGRETLMLHPLLAGLVLGLLWQDPEGAGWRAVGSMMYFATAGAVSLFLWAAIKSFAKKRGLKLTLPGSSSSPPPERRKS